MTWIHTFLILLAAFVSVFFEAAFQGIRSLFGTQIDLLPALMVYASLYGNRFTVPLVAVTAGLFYDSLSANPLGITIVPLFLIGMAIQAYRDLILRDQLFAQIALGFAASLAAPLITLLVGTMLVLDHKVSLGAMLAMQALAVGFFMPDSVSSNCHQNKIILKFG